MCEHILSGIFLFIAKIKLVVTLLPNTNWTIKLAICHKT
jgi:hypothetical protein